MVDYKDRLSEAMKDSGVKTQALADFLGLSYQAVRKVLNGGTHAFTASNNNRAAEYLGVSPRWLSDGTPPKMSSQQSTVEPAGTPRTTRRTPVVGTAKMGDEGYYEELQHPTGFGDGFVDGYSSDPNAYALRVKGDSMHPAIRHGSFVVVEPNGAPVPGEYVVIALKNGARMVKELILERAGEIVIESVNGNHRKTIDRTDIEWIHPVAAVVLPSKWRSD